MIKKYSLHILQKAVHHALSLDSSMTEKLNTFEGKILEIIITPLNVNFFIHFSNSEMLLLSNSPKPPDTIIESSPLGLIKLSLLPASKVRSLFNDHIKISGDLELGQRIKQLFDEIDIDWESHLARFTGDVIAYQAGNFIRKGLAIKQQFSESMRQNITEYLQDEIRLFPSKEEINDFFEDVDNLVLDVERLIAQMKQHKL